MGDVRRKRHLSQSVENFLENPLIGKLNQTVPFIYDIHHRTRQQPFAKGNDRTDLCLFPRLYQGLPDIILTPFEEQDLDLRLGAFLYPKQSGRDDLRVIDDKTVPLS